MTIDNELLNTIITEVTTQTTTEGLFRSGLNHVLQQVNDTQELTDVSGILQADFVKLAAVNATAAQLNNAGAIVSTAAEIDQVVDGATFSADDLAVFTNNTLTQGQVDLVEALSTATLTAADINKLADVTASGAQIQNVAATVASTADINVVDGLSAAGVVTADLIRAKVLEDAGSGNNEQVLTTNGATPPTFRWTTPSSTDFVVEDGDGTEQIIGADQAIKFTEVSGGGINIDFSGTQAGTPADPFQLQFSLGALGIARGLIANDAIDSTKLADNSVNSEHYVDRSIDAVHIASNTVTANEIAANAIGNSELGGDAVQSANLADNSVNSEHYVDRSIDAVHIAANTITANEIAANAVGNSELGGDAVQSANLADNSVNSEHYVDRSIDAVHIATGSITANELAADSVGASEIAANAVGASEIAANAVGTSELASGVAVSNIGFTPYNSTNPSGFQTAAQVNTLIAAGSGGGTLDFNGIYTSTQFSLSNNFVFTVPTGETSATYVAEIEFGWRFQEAPTGNFGQNMHTGWVNYHGTTQPAFLEQGTGWRTAGGNVSLSGFGGNQSATIWLRVTGNVGIAAISSGAGNLNIRVYRMTS